MAGVVLEEGADAPDDLGVEAGELAGVVRDQDLLFDSRIAILLDIRHSVGVDDTTHLRQDLRNRSSTG